MALGDQSIIEAVESVSRSLVHLNFYRVHLLYFILTIIVSSGILYATSGSAFKISYTDALSICTSAMCNVGLTTINLSSLTGFQQSIVFVLMSMGDLSIVTISVVLIRRYFFSKKMSALVAESAAGRRIAQDIEEKHEGDSTRALTQGLSQSYSSGHWSGGIDNMLKSAMYRERPLADLNHQYLTDYGSFPAPWQLKRFKSVIQRFGRGHSEPVPRQDRYLSFEPSFDQRGRFISLDETQRHELGGVEYRALKVLTWLLPSYTLLWLGLVMLILAPYASDNKPTAEIIRTAQPGRLSPALVQLGYSNSGLNLLDANMIPLNRDYLVLILTGATILGGNTLYPVFLRFSVWLLHRVVHKDSELHRSLSFLLQHPRRCYLLLFPKRNTWILFAVQVSISLLAWVLWILLNIDQPAVDPGIPSGQRTMDGLFQALGIRSSGFYIIQISYVAPALKLFYMIVMYISAYPFIMSLRQTNIYEERSLGQDDEFKYGLDGSKRGSKSQLGVHIRNQLAYDIWWLFTVIFLICIIEHYPLRTQQPGFSIFSIIFEVVSAYGTVGLSLGVPYNNYSFCGAWHVLSKLILLTVMLRGRHRILPIAVDRAILLPGEELMEKLDKEYSTCSRETWQEIEARIREEERGAHVKRPKDGGQQDPEHEQPRPGGPDD